MPRRASWTAAVVALVGCGRLAFDVRDPMTRDAGGDAPIYVDPSTLPPFGAPVVVSELSLPGMDEDDPGLSRDQLEIWFDVRGTGASKLYTARRASISDPWSTPVPVTELNSSSDEEHPHLSFDNLTLYFTSGRGGDPDLYVVTRPDRDSPWGTPVALAPLNTLDTENMGGVDATETLLVFSRLAPGGSHDLYESRRASRADPWGPPSPVPGYATPGTLESSVHLDDLGRVMYFERGGNATIMWTQRPALDQPFAAYQPVTELDGPGQEGDPWLSPDLRTIYFAIENTASMKDLYMATR